MFHTTNYFLEEFFRHNSRDYQDGYKAGFNEAKIFSLEKLRTVFDEIKSQEAISEVTATTTSQTEDITKDKKGRWKTTRAIALGDSFFITKDTLQKLLKDLE